MNRTLKILIAILVLSSGVQAQKKSKNSEAEQMESVVKIRVKEYQQDSIQNTIQSYALQKSIIHVKLELQRNMFVPGPYAEFAEKFLGASAKQKAEDVYRIKDVQLVTSVENDLTQLYSIKVEGAAEFNTTAFKKYFGDFIIESAQNLHTGFSLADLSPVRFLDRGTETTTYDKSGGNNALPLIPVIADKTPERRAKDAADYILLLRKRRTELIGADVEAAYASNEAIKHALDEMKRMEDMYLSLFYGVYDDPIVLKYSFVIDPVVDKEDYVLGYLSVDKGFSINNAPSKQALSVNLKITPDMRAKQIPNTNHQALPYRVPMGCNLQMILGNETIMAERIQLMQFGPLMYLPVSMFVSPISSANQTNAK